MKRDKIRTLCHTETAVSLVVYFCQLSRAFESNVDLKREKCRKSISDTRRRLHGFEVVLQGCDSVARLIIMQAIDSGY
jgi:hypothetical protein